MNSRPLHHTLSFLCNTRHNIMCPPLTLPYLPMGVWCMARRQSAHHAWWRMLRIGGEFHADAPFYLHIMRRPSCVRKIPCDGALRRKMRESVQPMNNDALYLVLNTLDIVVWWRRSAEIKKEKALSVESETWRAYEMQTFAWTNINSFPLLTT